MTEAGRWTAAEIARRVVAGELSALEVVEACLERSHETEPRVGAFLRLHAAEARRQGEALDRRRAAGGSLGPLAGVPFALKDNIAVAGLPLTCGSRILEGYRSPFSATAVERLLAADGILLAQTNLDEFAMGSSCENSALGTTRNPWDGERVPGGSSGGSAAAVAAGSVPLAFGSDTGGSVRQPGAFCGVVGFKPTFGRVSRYGLVAFASSTDQIGPLTRTVRDTSLAYSVIAGPDPRDATCSQRPLEDPLTTLGDGAGGLRIGMIREAEGEGLEASCATGWRRALDRLADLGCRLEEVSVPHLGASIACYYVLAMSEASANLARFDGVRYGRRAARPADLEGLYLRSRSEGFGPEVKRRIMLGTFALSSGYYEAYYQRAAGVREELRRQLLGCLEKVDVLVSPTAPTGAFRRGERTQDPLAMYLADIYTAPASLVGLPAVSIPCGKDRDGLPVGLQIMGRPFGDAVVLRVAQAAESAYGWRVETAVGNGSGA